MADAIPSCVELVTRAGGSLTEDGRLLFPRSLVEDMVATGARDITFHGRDPVHDLAIGGDRTYFGTAGAAVHVVDVDSREYRDSTLVDLYDLARLIDGLEYISFFQRPVVARDMPSSRELDINTCYAGVAGTTKHVGVSFFDARHAADTIEMLHLIAGGEEAWRARPFVSCSCAFVVPPLRFSDEASRVLETCVRAGMPLKLVAAGQAGVTSPAALAGAVVQEIAEALASIVYVNLIVPGHPMLFAPWPFVSDPRTGAMSGGSGEQAVLMAACAQMGSFYDLPTSIAAGMTDSKLPDAQSGYEKAYTDALAGHAGGNMVYESAGMHASLLGVSFESYVIDNDMLGAILRTMRGFEVTEASLSVDVIREVCVEGPGHYLGHPQTLELMQKDYLYPEIGDRTSPKDWKEQGSTDVLLRASARVGEILSEHYPDYLDPALDEEIRRRFPIRLAKEHMVAGNGRW